MGSTACVWQLSKAPSGSGSYCCFWLAPEVNPSEPLGLDVKAGRGKWQDPAGATAKKGWLW